MNPTKYQGVNSGATEDYQVTFTSDIDSTIADDMQNYRTTNFFYTYIFEIKSKHCFKLDANYMKNAI
jgi:hypothetical protein